MKKILVVAFFMAFVAVATVRAQVTSPVVSCTAETQCFQFQYCWNSVCRDLPHEMMQGLVTG